MTATAPLPVVTETPPATVHGVGQRQRRRHERRRRARQQVMVILILVVAFGITVALLATEWLNSGAQREQAGLTQTQGRSLS